MVQQHKTCTKCGETKPLNGFHKNKATKDGVASRCKPCIVERQRRYYEANGEKLVEYQRFYREANRDETAERNHRYYEENREKLVEYQRFYREENPEKVAERQRRYYEENRDELLEYRRRHYEENREIINSKIAKRRSEEQKLAAKLATVPPRTPWTPGEDSFILADNGMTIYQKAIELGRTLTSVRGRRQMLLAKGGVSNDRANA